MRVEWQIYIAKGKAEWCICNMTLTKSCILPYKQNSSALSVLLYFTLKDMLTKDTLLTFNVLSTQHLLNDQMVFFNKNVSRVLLLYKYSTEHSITTPATTVFFFN